MVFSHGKDEAKNGHTSDAPIHEAAKAVLSQTISTLQESLSPTASINLSSGEAFKTNTARWSAYKAPKAGAVVNVANESDIEKTVTWATSNNIKFLAQAGGHGFTTSFKMTEEDIIVNLREMRDVDVDLSAGTCTIGAGALVGEVVAEAYKNKAHIAVGTCNSVGAIGACLGGGYGRLQGTYGLGVDNMISARLVTADGKCITVSAEENADLWWGIRGAGHGLGIVSSLKMKAYPQINDGQHWMSLLLFTPDKIETITEAINRLDWDQGMAVHVFYAAAPPNMKPAVIVSLWYPGAEEPAKKAYASLLSAGAIFEQSGLTPYDQVNAGADPFGEKGGQKPVWSTSVTHLEPKALRETWNLYVQFVEKYPDAAHSAVMIECYSVKKVQEFSDEDSAFPHRHVAYHGLIIPIYGDMAITPDAEALGLKFRSLLRESSGLSKNQVYVNFAHGDETKEELYGDSTRIEKIKALKQKWDAPGFFNQFNPVF